MSSNVRCDGRPVGWTDTALLGQGRILELIATGAPLEEILTSLARAVEPQIGGICSILLVDEEEKLRHGGSPPLPNARFGPVESIPFEVSGRSRRRSTGLGRPVVVADFLADPRWQDYHELVGRYGLRACCSTPFFSRYGQVLGTFAMYYTKPGKPCASEIELIEAAARLAAIAVERWQGDMALREAEQNYRTIFEEAIVGIFRTGPEGQYITVNPALARMLGYDSPEEVKASVTDISRQLYVDPEQRREFMSLVEKQGSVRDFEIQIYRKNGSKMWVSANARAIYRDGHIVAYEGTNEDITERKLLQQQLLQAQRLDAVGQLAGGIAHDFNNLLGVVLGQGELLLERLQTGDPSRRRIEQICLAAQRAVSLTAQLLAFSRQQILHPIVLDLNAVLRNLNDMMGRLIGEDIVIVNRLDPALGWVKGDVSQIEQVLMNLAVNARDAMPQGGTLTIETSNIDIDRMAQRYSGAGPGQYALLTITDTGQGMDEETMTQIFEPFFTTKEKSKGTGLGLATVYGIIKQSGGYISVTSELGSGTTFSIYLPRTNEALDVERPLETTQVSRESEGETILLVEDSAPLRSVTYEFLQEAGYQVLEADNAERALELAEKHNAPICLMITDVIMPIMNGRVLAARLAKTQPRMKVLYVSGYTDEAVFRCGVRPGRRDFLNKPFTRDALLNRVREVLNAAS